MSLIRIQSVRLVGCNPAAFDTPIAFDITCECLAPGVQEEVEWTLTYVGSALDETMDQELASAVVGPYAVGLNRFQLEADAAPDPALIPPQDLLDTTALLLVGKYRNREFVRVGYFVNNAPAETASAETLLLVNDLAAEPKARADHLFREVSISTPRLTTYMIGWDAPEPAPVMTASDAFLAAQQANSVELQEEEEAVSTDWDLEVATAEDAEENEEIDLVSSASDEAASPGSPCPDDQSEPAGGTGRHRVFSSRDGPAADTADTAAASSSPPGGVATSIAPVASASFTRVPQRPDSATGDEPGSKRRRLDEGNNNNPAQAAR
jgi:histone chaperone ASF1